MSISSLVQTWLRTFESGSSGPHHKPTKAEGLAVFAAIDPDPQDVVANHTVGSGEDGVRFMKAASGQFTLTYAATSGYNTYHRNKVINPEGVTNALDISFASYQGIGAASVKLYPGQSIEIFSNGSSWTSSPSINQLPRAFLPGSIINVRPDGSDSNDGLTSSTPVATIAHAFLLFRNAFDIGRGGGIQLLSGGGQFNLGAGIAWTYPLVGVGPLQLQGDSTTPTNVVLVVGGGTAIFGRDLSTLIVNGVDFECTTNGCSVFVVSQGTTFDLSFSQCGAFPLGQIASSAGAGASINVTGPMTFTGNFVELITATENGHGSFGDPVYNCTFLNPLTFTFLIVAQTNGVLVDNGGYTFDGAGAGGSSVGARLFAGTGARLSGFATHTVPGNTAGTIDATTFATST